MQILRTLVMLAVASGTTSPQTRSDPVLVTAVPDGRTIQVAVIGRVQLLGIEVPNGERKTRTRTSRVHDARERLAELVLHRWVRLEEESAHHGRGRLAYVVTEDGQFVNAVLVREGLARVTSGLSLSRLAELQRAQDEAKDARRGMWAHVSEREPTLNSEPTLNPEP
jgi:endonuclease YncB( thermonuclease family)